MNRIITFISVLCLCATMARAQKYVGGDISLLPTYEQHGVRFLDQYGSRVDPLPFWGKVAGWNAMRVRLFVDPSKASAAHRDEGVRQDLDYVTALCRRIKAEGYALLLDFHYSDTWTDPGQHTTPSAWQSSDPEVLADSVYRYTVRSLQHLRAHGVVPDFIQPGNEITQGMMWPTGRCYPNGQSVTTTASNASGSSGSGVGTFANLVKYLKAGVRGSKEVCPEARIVIHTELSKAWNVTTFYNTLGSQVAYDIIGLSYYPDYHGTLATLSSTLSTLERQHADKDIMIVETGYGARWSLNGNHSAAVQAAWPLSEAGQQRFTTDLIAELARHPKVTGLFWWMPEDNEYWADANPARSHWWNASLYTQNTGKPLAALFELQRFVGKDPTGIDRLTTDGPSHDAATHALPTASSASGNLAASSVSGTPAVPPSPLYNIMGQQVPPTPAQLPPGIYIVKGKKLLITR